MAGKLANKIRDGSAKIKRKSSIGSKKVSTATGKSVRKLLSPGGGPKEEPDVRATTDRPDVATEKNNGSPPKGEPRKSRGTAEKKGKGHRKKKNNNNNKKKKQSLHSAKAISSSSSSSSSFIDSEASCAADEHSSRGSYSTPQDQQHLAQGAASTGLSDLVSTVVQVAQTAASALGDTLQSRGEDSSSSSPVDRRLRPTRSFSVEDSPARLAAHQEYQRVMENPNLKSSSSVKLNWDLDDVQSPADHPTHSHQRAPRFSAESNRPAVSTLGKGELSLEALGAANGDETSESLANAGANGRRHRRLSSASNSRHPSNAGSNNNNNISPAESVESNSSHGLTEEQTSRRPSRSNTIASRSGGRKRATSNVSQNSLSPSDSYGSAINVPRAAGFAVASAKRNNEFHQLFKSVPEDDYLIEDFGCALSREILLQGRLYVSEHHVCFNSNIFGWVTNLVIAFSEIVAIEKKTTAGLFPNAIVIQTLHARNVFASFIGRDSSYDLLVSIWKTGGTSEMNGHYAHGSDSETEQGNASDSDSDSDEEYSSAEEDYEDAQRDGGYRNGNDADGTADADGAEDDTFGQTSGLVKQVGPQTHEPTEVDYKGEGDFDRDLLTEVIKAPLGNVYSLLFSNDTRFVKKFIEQNQKCWELSDIPDWKENSQGKKERAYSYIKPLNSSLGPKQTKCLVTEEEEIVDYNKEAVVVSTVQTPDVPSGNSFIIKTKFDLSWAENNCTRLHVSFGIDWSGKSWIKGPIEKGSQEGQLTFAKDLAAALNGAVSASVKPQRKSVVGRHKHKKPKRTRRKTPVTEEASKRTERSMAVRTILSVAETIVTVASPLLTNLSLISLLVSLACMLSLMRVERTVQIGGRAGGSAMMDSTQLTANWEHMWKQEEAGLWAWLEDRVSGNAGVLDTAVVRGNKGQYDFSKASDTDIDRWLGTRDLSESIKMAQYRLNLLKMKNADKSKELDLDSHNQKKKK